MVRMRVTLFMQQGNYGWSEHYMNSNSTFDGVAAAAATLRDVRVRMLPPSARITYIRISDDDDFRDSLLISEASSTGSASEIVDSASAFTACLIRIFATPKIRKSMYIRPAQVLEGVNSDRVLDAPTWISGFNPWRNLLIGASGWSINSMVRTGPKVPIQEIVGSGNYTQIEALGLTLAVDDRVVIQGVTQIKGYNGIYKVRATAAGDIYTLLPKRPLGNAVSSQGFAQKVVPTLFPIAGVSPIRVVSRRTGRPFDSPRGKSATV